MRKAFIMVLGMMFMGSSSTALASISDSPHNALPLPSNITVRLPKGLDAAVTTKGPTATPLTSAAVAAPLTDGTHKGKKKKTKIVYLTFDDGPAGNYTAEILTYLKAAGAHATFFENGDDTTIAGIGQGQPTGCNPSTDTCSYPTSGMNIRQAILPRNQELVATILAEGNQLATHSWDHPHFNGDSTRFPAIPALTTTQVAAEIGNARTLQKQLTISTQRPTGYDSKLFRFPYLESSTAATTYLASQGMIAVPSDVDPLDWEPTTTISDATLVSEVMNGAPANITLGTDAVTAVFNGAIVDLHDGTDALRRGHPTYLPLLLTALSNAGYATAIIPSA